MSEEPKREAREFWIDPANDLIYFCKTNGCIHVIEYSEVERLRVELAAMTEKFERNSIAAGDYSLKLAAVEAEIKILRSGKEV